MKDVKMCRVCLVPESDAALSSLRNDQDKAMFFEKFFGINLNDNQDALICDKCASKVDMVHAFIDSTRHLDATHFTAERCLHMCDDDGNPVCQCCLSTADLQGIRDRGPELVSLLLMVTGINVRDDQEKVFICSKCEKTLRRADSLDFAVNENQKQHFNKNTSQETFFKEIPAGKTVQSEPATNEFKCSECPKSYSQSYHLMVHIQSIHMKETRFNCNFCGNTTLFMETFLRHIATHLDVADETKRKKKKLPQPGKEAFVVSLTCQICSTDFESIASLKEHFMQKHQARRKFECDHCGWRSIYKKDVGDHITCKHLNPTVYDMYDKDRKFKCTFKGCKKRFKVSKLLKQHMDRTHSGIRYTCWWCQKSYCRKILLKKHQANCVQPYSATKTKT